VTPPSFQVRLSVQSVDCGPILPRLPGQVPNEALLRLSNEGSRPAEVIAVELDPRLPAEEAGLALLDRWETGAGVCVMGANRAGLGWGRGSTAGS
jgi:hypothetical protein